MQIHFFATVSALMWSTIAGAAPAGPLQPVDKWQLDFGETQCAAARPYGDANSPTIFGIIPALNQAFYKVLVSVPRAGPAYAKESLGTVNFGNGPIAADMLYYGKAGIKQSVYQFTLTAAEMAKAANATAVSLSSDQTNFNFSLSQMPALIAGLRKCSASLDQYWSNGATEVPSLSADIHALLTRKDYPTEAQFMKPLTTLQYRLLIDEKGSVAACDPIVPSGAQVVDTTACQIIAGRSKFRPAKDASGKPVRSAWTTPPLVWKSGIESAFDSGCVKMASNGRDLVNMCAGQQELRMPIQRTPPPPPPPPPSPH